MVDTTNFMSEYVKADELKAGDKAVILDEGEISEGDYGLQMNVTVELKGERRQLTINKTNCKRISEVFGSENKQWIGKVIGMEPSKVMVAGKLKDTIIMTPIVETARPEIKPGCAHERTIPLPGTDKGYCAACGQLVTIK